MLSVFLQKVGECIPSFQNHWSSSFSNGFKSKTLHPVTKYIYINRRNYECPTFEFRSALFGDFCYRLCLQ
jgi:hypothetical protein